MLIPWGTLLDCLHGRIISGFNLIIPNFNGSWMKAIGHRCALVIMIQKAAWTGPTAQEYIARVGHEDLSWIFNDSSI
jgi:hypothetical protein